MSDDPTTTNPTFRRKLADAMLGHSMADITTVLVDALAFILQKADDSVREKLIEEVCVRIARKAMEPGATLSGDKS